MTYGLNDHRITDHSSMPARDRGNLFSAKYQYYQTKDEKYVMFACMEPKFWTRFCASVDRPDLAEWNENPHVPVDFGVDQAGQRLVMQEVMHTRTLAEWMDLAAHEHLPIGPAYNDVRSLAEDPHVKSRGMFVEGEHPIAGPYTYVGESAVVEGQPFALGRHAPTLGEHTREILGDIGIPSDRMSEWIQTGVIA
jgi:crotonobetainyl-CoA:carnitine CoA-transferase CaiB-like acyl-CoA transferase